MESNGSTITFSTAKPLVLMYNCPFKPSKFLSFLGLNEMVKTVSAPTNVVSSIKKKYRFVPPNAIGLTYDFPKISN